MKARLTYINHVMNSKSRSIENTISEEISDMKLILYGLATTISKENLINYPVKLNNLISNFNPIFNIESKSLLKIAGIEVINKEGLEVANNMSPQFHSHLQNKENSFAKFCLNESKGDFFKVNTSAIRIGKYLNKQIIPISIKISDFKYNHIATICSGLIVEDLIDKLKFNFSYSKHFDGIKIFNYDQHDVYSHLKLNELSMQHLLTSWIFNRDIVLGYKLEDYPFLVEIKLKQTFFNLATYRFILYFLAILTLSSIMLTLLARSYKHYYMLPLESALKKLNSLSKFLDKENKVFQHDSDFEIMQTFSPKYFAEEVKDLVDRYYTLFLEQSVANNSQNEIRKKILNLIFLEQHFLPSAEIKIHEEKLYLNKLLTIVDEEYTTSPLDKVLEEISAYCCEFYDEIKIQVIIEKIDRKNFRFKKSALIEVIFNIFTFAIRSSLDIGPNDFTITGKFTGDNDFPTITIEAKQGNSIGDLIAKELGPDYPHTSLLSIFLLAKENKLFFNITKQEDKIFLILETIQKKIEFYDNFLLIDHK